MSWSKPVYSASSNVATVGYDSETKELLVTWQKSGKTSAYAQVPEELAVQAANAASVTEFLNAEIKPYYGHRYV